MKTITKLESDLANLGKPLCRRRMYYYIKLLKLRPIGPGKPHLYPDETSHKLAAYLGLKADTAGILSLAEIKRRAKGKRHVYGVKAKAGGRSKKGGGK